MIGAVLERRYRIEAPIARGGMSMVYRGTDERLDRPVAIKVMDPKFAADPTFVQRFEFEARAVAKLKHPSLVAVYDQGLDGEHAFLVMELVEGGTLRELLRERGPMPPHAVRAVAEPVLEAVGVAHRAGLVHRDIKPENILISDDGDVKIADFGLVRAIAAANTTSASVILGTAAYLSPEQVSTGSADARSDVYAFGVVIFEMLTGRAPFTGDNTMALAYRRVEQDVPAPGRYIPGVPPEFDEFVAGATSREPAHRYADAAVMGAALRAVAQQLQLPPYRVPAPRQSAEHVSEQYRPAADPVAAGPTAELAPQPAQQPVGPHHTKVVTTATSRAEPVPPPVPAPVPVQQRNPLIQDQRRSRRALVVWMLVVVLLAALVGIGGWWLGSGRYTTVPVVNGMDRAEVESAVRAAGLTPEFRRRASETVPAEAVINTEPAPGSRIARGSTVAILLSSGRPRVPPVKAGDSVASAEKAIREAGLAPVDGGEAFSSAPQGTVARLSPGAGTLLPAGSPVKVVRSKGSQPVRIPDVHGKKQARAQAQLEQLGLTVEIKQQFSRQVSGGDAIGTEPETGVQVSTGSTVTLLVSTSVEVPWLRGLSVADAKTKLTGVGLNATVQQTLPLEASIVVGQDPEPSVRVEPGSTVTVSALP